MTEEVVSCIIPVCNGETYLAEAIESVIAQDYAAVEIIVVDDGSTDDSAEVARSFRDRIHLIQQPNQGVSCARNNGVAASSGTLISFLDADDYCHPERFSQQAAPFQLNPDLDICNCLAKNFWSPEIDEQDRDPYHRLANDLTDDKTFLTSSWMLRRNLFDRMGGFIAGMAFAEDLDFLFRCKDAGARFMTLEQVLTFRRVHHNNTVNTRPDQQQRDITKALKSHMDRLRARRT